MKLRLYLTALFAALGFVFLEAVLFAAAIFVFAWSWNTFVTVHFSMQKIPYEQAVAIGVFAGLINTGLNSFFKRKGIK